MVSCSNANADHYACANVRKVKVTHLRDTARRLECRWRERTRKLRCSTAEPQHPADAQGSEFLAEIDDAVMKNLRADDIRFYGTATVQNQQPDEKTQSVRRQRRRSKEDTKLSLDYLLKTYESHNRSHLAIIVPS